MFPGKPVKERCYLLCCYQEEKLLRPRIIASLIRSGAIEVRQLSQITFRSQSHSYQSNIQWKSKTEIKSKLVYVYGVLMRVVKTITSMLGLTCTRESYLKIHLPKKYDYDSETKCLNVLIDTRIKKTCMLPNVKCVWNSFSS